MRQSNPLWIWRNNYEWRNLLCCYGLSVKKVQMNRNMQVVPYAVQARKFLLIPGICEYKTVTVWDIHKNNNFEKILIKKKDVIPYPLRLLVLQRPQPGILLSWTVLLNAGLKRGHFAQNLFTHNTCPHGFILYQMNMIFFITRFMLIAWYP